MSEQLTMILISSITTILTCVLSVILGIIGKKYSKEKELTNNAVNYLDIINDLMPSLITKYENIFKNGKGEEKLTLVLNELTKYCIDNNIEYNSEVLTQAINNYVSLSKTINKGK